MDLGFVEKVQTLLPELGFLALAALVIIQQVLHFAKTKRLQEHKAALERRSVSMKAALELKLQVQKADHEREVRTHEATIRWYESEAQRIKDIHESRGPIVQKLRGQILEFQHLARGVGNGHGKTLRGLETNYCQHLKNYYFELRDEARLQHTFLGDLGKEIYQAITKLTDAGKPLMDYCDAGSGSIPNVDLEMEGAYAQAMKLLDRLGTSPERVRAPPF